MNITTRQLQTDEFIERVEKRLINPMESNKVS